MKHQERHISVMCAQNPFFVLRTREVGAKIGENTDFSIVFHQKLDKAF